MHAIQNDQKTGNLRFPRLIVGGVEQEIGKPRHRRFNNFIFLHGLVSDMITIPLVIDRLLPFLVHIASSRRDS